MAPARPTATRRLLAAGGMGVVTGVGFAPIAAWPIAVLAGWDTTAIVFLVWVVVAVLRLPDGAVAVAATREDPNRAATDMVLTVGAVACLGGVGFLLVEASSSDGDAKAALVALALGSVVASWLVVHTIFVLRYARLYYAAPVGGVDFHSDTDPTYRDFAYLAFTVGMTYQVSDTNITQRTLRVSVLRHALLSFLFGTTILAVTINIVAGLL